MDLSQFGIGDGNNTGLTIPGLENLQNMFATIMTASMIIGGLFIVLYIINLIQRMRADRAMIAMQKDIAAIKALLERQVPQPTRPNETAVQPEPTAAAQIQSQNDNITRA